MGEPSDAAWRRFGQLAAAALARLAERDASLTTGASATPPRAGAPVSTLEAVA